MKRLTVALLNFQRFSHFTYVTWRADHVVRRSDVISRVLTFQRGGPETISGGVRDINLFPGIGCVSFVFCSVFVYDGDLGILMNTDSGRPALLLLSSVLTQSYWLLLQTSDPTGIWIKSPWGISKCK